MLIDVETVSQGFGKKVIQLNTIGKYNIKSLIFL